MLRNTLFLFVFLSATFASAQTARVVDVPFRTGVTQRFLLLPAENARAAVILFAGGDGSIDISPDGGISEGDACGARAYHGYNGIEAEVVGKIATWIKSN